MQRDVAPAQLHYHAIVGREQLLVATHSIGQQNYARDGIKGQPFERKNSSFDHWLE
jgi:hypothetical protein